MSDINTQPKYKIGAVSRLTGVPTDTLRVWERRYNIVEPQRSEGGSRLYSEEDVSRLSMIKRLVSNGDAIGAVANLSAHQLSERLNAVDGLSGERDDQHPTRVILVGATLVPRFAEQEHDPEIDGIELVGAYSNPEACDGVNQDCDVLVVEYAALDAHTQGEVRTMAQACNAGRVIVVYGYGSNDHVDALTKARVVPLRFPVSWEELRWVCRPKLAVNRAEGTVADFDAYLYEKAPGRIFNDDALTKVSKMPTALKCECPKHLAEIVMSLARFEYYSSLCENNSKEDAALHAYLHVTTAQAREIMETALARLAEAEGFELETAGEVKGD